MKKILIISSLILIISCSLDTFNPDNLASWSINFDFPVFKTTYTIDELLEDTDGLDVEQYENTSDSIYVLNASVESNVIIDEFTITKDGDVVNPEIEQIQPYEFEIPTLPEELDGINFLDVDLIIDVDLDQFNTELADSVIVDHVTITGTNDDGDVVTASITNQDVMVNGTLEIEDPEPLVNMRPTLVIVEGQVTIYPTDNEGEVFATDIIFLNTRLHAPMILEITETATFSGDPQKIDGVVEEDLLEELYLFVDIDNQLELGGTMQALVSQDTNYFQENSPISPDILFTLDLFPLEHTIDTIKIDEDKLNIFADSTYLKPNMNFTGYTDAMGNIQPTRLFTDDSISILIYSSTQLLIDPQNMGEED